MKITSEHLEQTRLLLLEKGEALNLSTKAAQEAADRRDQITGELRLLQGAFDVLAATYAQDADLTANQGNDLPAAAQAIIGHKPAASAKA
jgi:hypothetical protein